MGLSKKMKREMGFYLEDSAIINTYRSYLGIIDHDLLLRRYAPPLLPKVRKFPQSGDLGDRNSDARSHAPASGITSSSDKHIAGGRLGRKSLRPTIVITDLGGSGHGGDEPRLP
jgi:hypothetical protein